MSEDLKPARCGCGGKAKVISYLSREYCKMAYYVRCVECGTETDDLLSETEAIQAWNKAMGAKDINVPRKERTAKVEHKSDTYVVTPTKSTTTSFETRTNLWEECGNCHAMGMYHGWNYCPKCGVKLDWSENE